jgi:integrase
MAKKELFFAYYDRMIAQKKAYETSAVTLTRIDVIWRKSIAPFWRDVDPKKINQEMVVDFINWHKSNRPGVQLINVFKYLGNIFAVMVESGAMDQAKKPKLDLPRDEQKHHAKQKGRYITDAEFDQILSQTKGWFRLFLLIAFTTGMRKMELGKLELSRLDFDPNSMRFIISLETDDTKTGMARKIPIPGALNAMIREQIKPTAKHLFSAPNSEANHIPAQFIDREWSKAKKAAGIVGRMREHDIRHTAASNMAKAGINPIMATTILGMSLSTFQKRYLKLTPEDLMLASESAIMRLNKDKIS